MISAAGDTVAARGVVVAAREAAAEAGAAALAAGGSAVDAAVASAFAVSVVDPANCGLGGYGGFLVYAPPGGAPVCVDFDTWVPDRVDPATFHLPGDDSVSVGGGPGVAPPQVVPGLLTAHERFGRLPLAEVVAPAVRLAREGFAVGRDLERAMVEHWERTGGSRPELARIFFPEGRPPVPGTVIVQPELAETIGEIVSRGADSFRSGPIVDAICEATAGDGGFLEPEDFLRETVVVRAPEQVSFESATVYSPPRAKSGAGVLLDALAELDPDRLGANRDRTYVVELVRSLAAAWRRRTEAARAALNARHTTTLAAADGDGGLVALTFTHGSLWFGAGIVPPGTGIVLNAGANLFVTADGGPLAATNMCPVVVEHGDARHAVGGTGGPRIPGILLSAVVDVVHYGSTLAEAIAAPHLSARALDGTLEAEPELLERIGGGSAIEPGSFGPAAGISAAEDGLLPAADPRFEVGVAFG